MSDVEQIVPREGLRRFLDERFGPSEAAIEVSRLGGHSNLTFLVRRGDEEWVLRRPPRGEILPGTHEMDREYVVYSGLTELGKPVPVPTPVALCTDEDVIGAPFYLMSFVDGVVVRNEVPEAFDTREHRRRMGEVLCDRLADIHAVEWRGTRLEELARKPEGFLERNLRRMGQLYDAVRHREVPEIDEAGEWLREHAPEQKETTLTHGDYKLDNVMLAPEPPPEIAAVVDWEVSTIGDPLVDLGWMLFFSPESEDPDVGSVSDQVTREPGYPTRAELARRYADRTGRPLDDLPFYAALAGWKIAIIMEGSYKRHLDGDADDPLFETLDEGVPRLARRALDFIRGDLELVP